MKTDHSSNKRPNVRTKSRALWATRAGLRALSPTAPRLAAAWAERLFLTARRHERPFWERETLASALASRLAHDGGWLPTWTWQPASRDVFARPAARTILLVHGWEGRGSQLATIVPYLLARDLRVVTFDAPGHGDSSLPRASVVEHARAICAVAHAVGGIHGIVGHSVGGAAALFATRLGLEAKRFALISPPTTPIQFASTFARILGLDDTTKSAMMARIEARYAIRFDDLDARRDAATITAPLLVVHDRDDAIVPFANGEAIASAARRGRLISTTGLGHNAMVRAPKVLETIADFVGQREEGSSFADTLDGELFLRDIRWTRAIEHALAG